MPNDELNSLNLVTIVGNPFHGLIVNGEIELPNAELLPHGQPDGGSTVSVGEAGLPAPVRDAEEQAFDTANGFQWFNKAVLSGVDNYFYGQALGRDRIIYVDPEGQSWILKADFDKRVQGSFAEIEVTLTHKLGIFDSDQVLGEAGAPGLQPIEEILKLPFFLLDDPAAERGRIIDFTPGGGLKNLEQNRDGTDIMINLHGSFNGALPGSRQHLLFAFRFSISGVGGEDGAGIVVSNPVIYRSEAQCLDIGTDTQITDTLEVYNNPSISISETGSADACTSIRCNTGEDPPCTQCTGSFDTSASDPSVPFEDPPLPPFTGLGSVQPWQGERSSEQSYDALIHIFFDESGGLIEVSVSELAETFGEAISDTFFTGTSHFSTSRGCVDGIFGCSHDFDSQEQESSRSWASNSEAEWHGTFTWTSTMKFNGVDRSSHSAKVEISRFRTRDWVFDKPLVVSDSGTCPLNQTEENPGFQDFCDSNAIANWSGAALNQDGHGNNGGTLTRQFISTNQIRVFYDDVLQCEDEATADTGVIEGFIVSLISNSIQAGVSARNGGWGGGDHSPGEDPGGFYSSGEFNAGFVAAGHATNCNKVYSMRVQAQLDTCLQDSKWFDTISQAITVEEERTEDSIPNASEDPFTLNTAVNNVTPVCFT